MTLLDPLGAVNNVVTPANEDEDELLPLPPPPHDTNIAAEPRNTLNIRTVLVKTLEKAILVGSLSGLITLNFISIPYALFLSAKSIGNLDRS
jgi:hypothetical protein